MVPRLLLDSGICHVTSGSNELKLAAWNLQSDKIWAWKWSRIAWLLHLYICGVTGSLIMPYILYVLVYLFIYICRERDCSFIACSGSNGTGKIAVRCEHFKNRVIKWVRYGTEQRNIYFYIQVIRSHPSRTASQQCNWFRKPLNCHKRLNDCLRAGCCVTRTGEY
jgi:hypothetical protein